MNKIRCFLFALPLFTVLIACRPTNSNDILPTLNVTADETIAALFSQTPQPLGGAVGGVSAAVGISNFQTPAVTATPIPATYTLPPNEPAPTQTQIPTRTDTPTATNTPSPTNTLPPTAVPVAVNAAPAETAVPTPVTPFDVSDTVINILLLGNDGAGAQGGRTDTIIILSVNKETKTASMLSLPRDLYVYIPDWTMNRINTALPHGHGVDYGVEESGQPGSGGGRLVKETILYNFGIEIDYYVRVGFNTFQETVNLLDGVEIVVNCPLTDWRLISPDLDPNIEENYHQFTLETGVHEMDSDLALWYARSRITTSDFDRNRRQQQLLQAILDKGLALNLIAQLPALWETYKETVETDMPFNEILSLASLAPAVRENGVQHLAFPPNALRSWSVPSSGAAVQLLQWEAAEPVLKSLLQPPALNRATRPPIVVEVVTDNWVWYRQTAENLSWFGFTPTSRLVESPPADRTEITYYGSNLKGSFDWLMAWILNKGTSEITLNPNPHPANADYTITLGWDFNPCRPYRQAPLYQ